MRGDDNKKTRIIGNEVSFLQILFFSHFYSLIETSLITAINISSADKISFAFNFIPDP